MLRLVIVLLLALSSTALAAPEGFRESSRLTPRAQAISGNTAAVVYCARTYAAWEAKVRTVFGDSAPVARIRALTTYAEDAMYLSPSVCQPLEKWIRGKRVSPWDVGASAHVFAHETAHLAGTVEERAAECSSLRALPSILRRHFAVKKAKTLSAMLVAAKTLNRRSPYPC